MRKLSALAFILIIGFIGIGCDSGNGDDEPTAAERLVGNWALSGISDDDGNQMVTFAEGFNSIVVSFSNNDTYSIAIDSKLPDGDQTISGNYTIDEGLNRLTLNTEFAGQAIGLVFNYAFTGDTMATFTATGSTSTLLNVMLGSTLLGTIELKLTKM